MIIIYILIKYHHNGYLIKNWGYLISPAYVFNQSFLPIWAFPGRCVLPSFILEWMNTITGFLVFIHRCYPHRLVVFTQIKADTYLLPAVLARINFVSWFSDYCWMSDWWGMKNNNNSSLLNPPMDWSKQLQTLYQVLCTVVMNL